MELTTEINQQSLLEEKFYRELLRIRLVEERIVREYPTDKIKSPIHLSIGQEPVSVGVCQALLENDVVFGTYRSHALYLAKGGDINAMIAELFGKVTGCGRGKSGSMHLVDVDSGVMGTSAVVGTTIPNAVGYAQALRYQKSNSIVVCFFGDGATEEGVFFESLNYAALNSVPILFICENNKYAIHTGQEIRQSSLDLIGKVQAFSIPARTIKNNDVYSIYYAATESVEKIRSGHSPEFLECMTYRWLEHVGPREDFELDYRSKSELEPWIQQDSVTQLAEKIDSNSVNKIVRDIELEIDEAFNFAERSPFPDSTELMSHLYK